MNKIPIIALCGKAGAGKDTVMREALKREPLLHEIISCTTRPQREGEENGVNYFFLTEEEFVNKIVQEEMLETTEFNSWLYGTSIDQLNTDGDKINIGIFNPEGLDNLKEWSGLDVCIIYIYVDDKERILRQLNREQHPNVKEIVRRFGTDDLDFKLYDQNAMPCLYLPNNNQQELEQAVDVIIGLAKKIFISENAYIVSAENSQEG